MTMHFYVSQINSWPNKAVLKWTWEMAWSLPYVILRMEKKKVVPTLV